VAPVKMVSFIGLFHSTLPFVRLWARLPVLRDKSDLGLIPYIPADRK
jgi:hypothetical protein